MIQPRLASLALLGLLACGSAGRTVVAADVAPAPAPAAPAKASDPADAPLPLRPEIVHGKLSNGLTYSIFKHQKPEKRAFLWLAVNAGSVQEDEDQRGLAHFDEHMSFDGTQHFAKTAIIDYIEKIGMRFGADLNAYTNYDQTVYQLEVPTDDAGYLGTGLDILRDWAGSATYDPKELERERGVVLEEWRLGRGAGQRLFDKQALVLFDGSRYAKRLTIGLPEVIQGASRETLLRFYKDFYRPDLMAVIVVGDVDAAWIEAELKKRFGDLRNPSPERPRTDAGLPLAEGTRIAIEADHELPAVQLGIYNMLRHRPEVSLNDYRRSLVENLYSSMLGERFEEVRRRAHSPLRSAGGAIFPFTREIDAFGRFGEIKSGKVEEALRVLMAEVLRVEAHGFTASELERARADVQRSYDEDLAREATISSRALTEELVRNFLTGELVIGPRAEDELTTKLLPTITLEELNQAGARFGGEKNRVVLISGPDKAQLPSEKRVRELIAEVQAAQLPAWDDGSSTAPLMSSLPTPGRVTAEKKLAAVDATEWTLSNGVRVVAKTTDFEADSLAIQGFSPGGSSVLPESEYNAARFADAAVQACGVGTFSPVSLRKRLAGRSAFASVALGEQNESMIAAGSALDAELIFQLLHLRLTAPRADPDEFELWKTNAVERLQEQQRDPQTQFQRLSAATLYQNNPRRLPPLATDLEPLQLEKELAIYKDRFGDASGMTFVIVGSLPIEKLRPLVETYLASLPSSGRKETEHDLKIRKAPGVVDKTWRLGDAPKAAMSLDFHGDDSWSRDKERDLYILSRVLSIRLREVLRSDLGGVYGVSAGGSISRSPHQERSFQIRFGCDPANVDRLTAATREELKKVAASGASDELLGKVKQAYLRERETAMRENSFWMGRLLSVYRYGDDPAIILDTAPTIARMTSANVAASAQRYLDDKEVYRAVMLPAQKN